MGKTMVASVVNAFRDLPLSDKEYALEILQKQIIEERRKALASRVQEARANYRAGKVKKGIAKDLLKDLNRD
jgi:hypothetical protein